MQITKNKFIFSILLPLVSGVLLILASSGAFASCSGSAVYPAAASCSNAPPVNSNSNVSSCTTSSGPIACVSSNPSFTPNCSAIGQCTNGVCTITTLNVSTNAGESPGSDNGVVTLSDPCQPGSNLLFTPLYDLTIAAADQTIIITNPAPASAPIGSTYTPAATGGGSGNPVVFTIDAGSTVGACSIAGGVVSYTGVGTCVIDANQAGNTNYNAATQEQQTTNVVKADQTISFISTAPTNPPINSTYTPTATATSGLPVTFTIDASTSGNCSISGGVVTFTAAGLCTIDANQAGNGTYNAAPQVQQSTTAVKINQTISFISTAPTNPPINSHYTPTATATSGLAVTFTIDSSTASNCSISGGIVTFNATGNCIINANQAGNGTYNAAPQAQQSTTAVKISQTISFTSTAPVNPAFGSTYTPTATATSSLAVTITIDPGSTPGACSLSGGVVTFNGAGSCIIDANQPGNATYAAAPQVQQNITVSKTNQTITFNPLPPASAPVEATYTPQATGGASGNPVVFTLDPSSTPGACTLSGGIVSFTNPGNCIIDANQAGNANYNAAPQVQYTIVVTKATQTITFTSQPPANPQVGGSYLLSATGGDSGNPVTFSIDAGSSSGACSVSGNLVNFTGQGTCIIDANQAGNIDFEPAPQMQQTLQVVFAPFGSLTLVKNSLGRDGTFTFATSIAGASVVTLATNNGSAQQTFSNIPVGTYTLSETNLPPGWKLTDVQCDGVTMDPAAVNVTLVPGSAVTCVFTNVFDVAYIQQKTLEAIASFLTNRAHLMLSAAPDRRRMERILSNTMQPSAGLRPNVSDNQLSLNLSTSLRQLENNSLALPRSLDFWAQAHVNYFKRHSQVIRDHAEFSLVYVGADYLYSDNLLLGVLGEFDNFNERSNAIFNLHATGNGWTAGPYFSARLLPNLYFHSRMAFGSSHNKINPFVEYDTFNTFRQLYDAEVTGDFLFNALRISPSLGVYYFNEKQGNFVNTLQVEIPSQEVSLGQLVVGPELGYPLYTSERIIAELSVILEGIYNFQNTGYLIPQQTTLSNFYGRIYVGANILTNMNISLYPMFMWDGVGANFENLSGQIQIRTSID